MKSEEAGEGERDDEDKWRRKQREEQGGFSRSHAVEQTEEVKQQDADMLQYCYFLNILSYKKTFFLLKDPFIQPHMINYPTTFIVGVLFRKQHI